MNKVFPLLLAGSVLLLGYAYIQYRPGADAVTITRSSDAVQRLPSAEYDRLAQQEDVFVIDVHTPEQTHLPWTDAVIPFTDLITRQDALPKDLDRPILVYCRSGGMSAEASQTLRQLGYTNVYDLTGGAQAYQQQQSGVIISPDHQELGTVIFGDVTRTFFELSNFTDREIILSRLSTSCGCTSAEADSETLAPGESTLINVSFDPAVHGDDTDMGDITRTIYVETDHPEYPRFEVTIAAEVVKE